MGMGAMGIEMSGTMGMRMRHWTGNGNGNGKGMIPREWERIGTTAAFPYTSSLHGGYQHAV